jgi:type VI secretion system protein ImpK
MSALFDRKGGGSRRPPARGAGSRRRARPSFDDDPDEDELDETEEFEEDEERPAGRRRPAAGGKRRSARSPRGGGKSSSGGLFGGRERPSARRGGARRVDWDDADDDDESAHGEDVQSWVDEDEADEERPRRRRRSRERKASHPRQTLLDLCTPVFGHAAVLPREPGGVHPSYQQFRDEVMGALQKIISEAEENGIEREDAIEARYALALFMDEQVGLSEWSGRAQWSSEPFSMVLLNDPQGGVNFYTHLEQLGERQKAVKRIYLLCLALGYRGKYAELDPTQQAAEIGNIRQRTLRSIQEPLDQRDVLFPEAYAEAEPLEGQVPPPPKWWIAASAGLTVLFIVLWALLYWYAGSYQPESARERLGGLLKETPAAAQAADQSPGGEGAQ